MMKKNGVITEKTKQRRKTILQAMVLVSIIAIAIAGLWLLVGYLREGDEVEAISSTINVSLRIRGDGWVIEYSNAYTFNNTVYKLLLECADRYNFSVSYTYWPGYDSVFINSINGLRNGENGMWWQYYVNEVYGEVGCDRKEIFDGDIVEWRFEEPGQ